MIPFLGLIPWLRVGTYVAAFAAGVAVTQYIHNHQEMKEQLEEQEVAIEVAKETAELTTKTDIAVSTQIEQDRTQFENRRTAVAAFRGLKMQPNKEKAHEELQGVVSISDGSSGSAVGDCNPGDSLPVAAVELWNSANKGEAPDPARVTDATASGVTLADAVAQHDIEALICHNAIEQVKGWQEFYKGLQKIYEEDR